MIYQSMLGYGVAILVHLLRTLSFSQWHLTGHSQLVRFLWPSGATSLLARGWSLAHEVVWGTWREVDCLAMGLVLAVLGLVESEEHISGAVVGLPLHLPGI